MSVHQVTMSDKFIVIFIKTFIFTVMVASAIAFFFGNNIRCHFKKKEVLRGIASRFFDPKAVEFRNVSFESDVIMCGEVNGKNRYGAYAGFKKFYIIGYGIDKNPWILTEGDEYFNEKFLSEKCKHFLKGTPVEIIPCR